MEVKLPETKPVRPASKIADIATNVLLQNTCLSVAECLTGELDKLMNDFQTGNLPLFFLYKQLL